MIIRSQQLPAKRVPLGLSSWIPRKVEGLHEDNKYTVPWCALQAGPKLTKRSAL